MKTEKILNILRIILLAQYIIFIASCFFYAGVLYEYKNVCPKGENISLITGGKIYLDNVNSNFENVIETKININDLNLENIIKEGNKSGMDK